MLFSPKKIHKFINLQYVTVQRINTILYRLQQISLSNLQTNVWTTYMGVNFNEIFEGLVFQKSCTQYLYSTLTYRPINRCSNTGAALVHTHYFQCPHQLEQFQLAWSAEAEKELFLPRVLARDRCSNRIKLPITMTHYLGLNGFSRAQLPY